MLGDTKLDRMSSTASVVRSACPNSPSSETIASSAGKSASVAK
jgi:hypothetical protein